jgi:predicted GIY-YIG superfamily endonuclease
LRSQEEGNLQKQIAEALEQEKALKKAQRKAEVNLFAAAWQEQAKIKKLDNEINNVLMKAI